MHPIRKRRLLIITAVTLLLGAAIGLVMYALQQNINLFYSPSQIKTGDVPYNINIRAGGMVVEGSVIRDQKNLSVSFEVTDFQSKVRIEYYGILPDLFREGQGIVAQGKLMDNGVFQASQVLAKHDEEYMPPEITEALENAQSTPQNKVQKNTMNTPSIY